MWVGRWGSDDITGMGVWVGGWGSDDITGRECGWVGE